jgi:hypothetical protein
MRGMTPGYFLFDIGWRKALGMGFALCYITPSRIWRCGRLLKRRSDGSMDGWDGEDIL